MANRRPPQRKKAPRPLPPGEQFFTPGATGPRKTVETRSAPLLVYLYQMPKWLLPVALVAFFIGGFALPDWRGGLCMLPVIAFTGWLAYLSWPSLRVGARVLRLALLVFLLAVAVTRFGGF
ncbi:DUF6703 family protein [Herbidospora yilanensis]|uniref:DUF6703 family protein n=1 Tax=Herbidospora yilanensis TaxID=354426 RepID=UPI0007828EAC|nr:DUF6703 family protein [Herbidospora yilanensis]